MERRRDARVARRRGCIGVVAMALQTSGCGLTEIAAWEDDHGSAFDGGAPPTIHRWKELVVVDPTLLADGADNTDPNAPWSFRRQLEWFAQSSERAPRLALEWLSEWTSLVEVGDDRAPVVTRPGVQTMLLDPWQALGTDAHAERGLPLEHAPFRLIAIVNRLDLALSPCDGGGGELRYVYAGEDPSTGASLDMTVIVEVPYPLTRTAAEWARAWNAVVREDSEGYAAALEELTRAIQDHVDPARARLRTNERAFAPEMGWELREFHRAEAEDGLTLGQVPLASTPREDLPEGVLAAALNTHADAVLDGTLVLPSALQGGAASLRTPDFRWRVPEVDEELATAFSAGTCNGCHGGEREALPFQHIAPGAASADPARLSRFLNDPDGGRDDLTRREERLLELIGVTCPDTEEGYP